MQLSTYFLLLFLLHTPNHFLILPPHFKPTNSYPTFFQPFRPDFSKKFLILGNLESEIRSFFTDDIIRFFESHQIYHLESNGEALVIFDKIKLARTDETMAFIDYGKELATLLDGRTTLS